MVVGIALALLGEHSPHDVLRVLFIIWGCTQRIHRPQQYKHTQHTRTHAHIAHTHTCIHITHIYTHIPTVACVGSQSVVATQEKMGEVENA